MILGCLRSQDSGRVSGVIGIGRKTSEKRE